MRESIVFQGTMGAPFSVAVGVEARDVDRGQITKDLLIMPQRIDFILRVT